MKVNDMDFNWKVYHWYSDVGHAWLKVPYTAIYRLGMSRLISSYSYQRGNYVYLEEDRDATLFLNALNHLGIKYKTIAHSCDRYSKIRSYKSYNTLGVYDNDEWYLGLENIVKSWKEVKCYV